MPGSRAAGKVLGQVVLDLDATLVSAHDKQGAWEGNFKGGFGYHRLGTWLDNSNEALARLLRPVTPAATPPPITWPLLDGSCAGAAAGSLARQADPDPG